MSEKQIEQEILFVLNQKPNCLAFKVNTEGWYDKSKGRYRMRPQVLGVPGQGIPDIVAFVTMGGIPVSVFFEVKRPGNYQTDRQREFQALAQKKGGFYFTVRSTQEVDHWLAHVNAQILVSTGCSS